MRASSLFDLEIICNFSEITHKINLYFYFAIIVIFLRLYPQADGGIIC